MTQEETIKAYEAHKVAVKSYATDRMKEKDIAKRKFIDKYSYHGRLSDRYLFYISRAIDKGEGFALPEKDFHEFINRACHYCGCAGAKGIDRINSSIGYTLINIVPCCHRCNSIKWEKNYDDFLSYVKIIYEHMNLQDWKKA